MNFERNGYFVYGANFPVLCGDLFFEIMRIVMKKNLQQLFQEFMYESEFVKRVRPETLRGYKTTFELFTRLTPSVTLDSLSTKKIVDFFKLLQERKRIVGKGIIKIGIKKSTVATYWGKLSCFFEWLVVKDYLMVNPLKEMRYPSPEYDDRKYLKKEEVEKIITAILTNHHDNILLLKRNLVLFYILIFCGLRREELLLLQIRDIDFERKMLTVRGDTSKSGRTRQIPLHSTTIMYLKDYLIARKKYVTPYLIVSKSRDERLTTNGLKHLIQKLNNSSEVSFHLHQLRHTFAVNFLKTSNNIVKLKQLLGHKNISMTIIYLRCLPTDELRADIENMNIDSLI
jgi:integrase/recombinase XerD